MSSPKTVLITGCSDGGIGSSLTKVFQQRGLRVFASARDTGKMSEIASLPNVTTLTLDVVKPSDIANAVELVKKETGGTLDYLINNAGHNHFMPVLDIDIEEARSLYETNVWGPLAITQAFSPLVIKAKGNMVFITSISGHVNCPWMGTYASSKRSLEILAETLRLEMKLFNVNVLSVVTGVVASKGQTYFDDWALPEGSLYKPIEDIIAHRTRGGDGIPRMPTMEFAAPVVDAILERATQKLWCGNHADKIKAGFGPSVPQEAADAGIVIGTGLDTWEKVPDP